MEEFEETTPTEVVDDQTQGEDQTDQPVETPNNNDETEVVQEETTTVPDNTPVYSEQLELTNHLISGQIFFLGLIFGVILFKIFWDRFKV